MKICPSCGHENAEDARFCSQCATPLDTPAASREERKVVTCLFCDLVGFTARAERMDPEDVRRLLQPYHARVRSELERFGGTVEKFIGDAVMAVFGAPVAHEDDAERAVRAALAIRDAFDDEGELEVRIGITTGEALIALGARPQEGEGMASGDVVNTAARLQSAAPVNGILVDETTFRSTERSIEYRQQQAVEAKGKAIRVSVWEAVRARARVGVERVGGAELVGRERELTLLRETFGRVAGERRPQLVTLVGVPGIGKSRLVFELFETIQTGEYGLVYWRHGRSLPYGEGVTFWALGEMVKAQAGILESEGAEAATEKLRRAVATVVPDEAEAGWVERHLRPLVGLETETPTGEAQRGEAFAAWRRFMEALAEERPLVLVFEDLHWADDALLDFVDYLVEWASGAPLLVLSTARPELLSRRPGWGGGKVNSSTILLSPLSGEETAALVHALLGRSVIDADVQAQLLEHAGGNPLYAEEFTRMLSERPGDTVLPETVQGLIAARLDTLPREEKELLSHAAVVGRAFWLGALGAERWLLEERLHTLERTEFVRRERRSSVAGEVEYSFRHALTRDVAYEQIPRAQRAEKHILAAEWIETLGRAEDHAEMLAHHYGAALDYARATGLDLSAYEARARATFREAGDRAASLNSYAAAVRFYDEMLALGSLDDAADAEVRFRRAKALHISQRDGSDVALEEAREALLKAGNSEQSAEADALLGEVWWLRGSRDRAFQHLDRARVLVQGLPPSAGKAHVLSQVARFRMLADENQDAIQLGGEVLSMAESLGLAELRAHALDSIGVARFKLGDLSGLDDLERSIEIALEARSPEASRGYNNVGATAWALGDLRRASTAFDNSVIVGEQLGSASLGYARTIQIELLFWSGDWNEGLRRADVLLAACDAGESNYRESQVRMKRARVRLARDDVAGAVADLGTTVQSARAAGDPQALLTTLVGTARLYAEAGHTSEARTLARDALAEPPIYWALTDLAWIAEEVDCQKELSEWIHRIPLETKWRKAARALLQRDFATAADVFYEIGALDDEALARLRAAERLAVDGQRAEADQQLQRALRFWRSVGATRYIRECEALLGDVSEIPA